MNPFPLHQLFYGLPRQRIVDVGASPIDGVPPYEALRRSGRADLVGFEPDEVQFAALLELGERDATFLPHAIGDGQSGTLHVCKSPGMTSLLEPDQKVLSHFHGFSGWGEVIKTLPVQTVRLDDCPETRHTDYLKLDIQGGELAALSGATELLSDALCVHIEVQFVPFYKDQPLFAELDQALRAAGFMLHRFLPIHSRVFQPLLVNDDIYAGLSQELWTDAVYFKNFANFDRLEESALLKVAEIANDLYQSIDLAALALRHADKRGGSTREAEYLQALSSGIPAIVG